MQCTSYLFGFTPIGMLGAPKYPEPTIGVSKHLFLELRSAGSNATTQTELEFQEMLYHWAVGIISDRISMTTQVFPEVL